MRELLLSQGSRIRGYKKIRKLQLLIPFVLILFTSTATAQWNTQSPLPTHLDIRGIAAPTTERVFIATDDNSFDDGGALFESTDGGITWVQRNIPFSLGNPLNGIFFLDNQNGWVFGNENYRTTDGGTNWVQLPFLGSVYFMKFYSPTFGLTTGNFDRYVSYDAGNSWEVSPNNIFAFDFIDELNGLGISETGIYKTTDGGNTFSFVYAGNAKSIAFLSAAIAVAIADDSFLRSTDGGVTWNPVTSASGRHELFAFSPEVVLASGRTGPYPNYDDRVLRTSDGGQTWTDLGEVIPAGVFAFSIANPQNMVASDFEGNMFHSSDAGLNWSQTFVSPGQFPGFLSSAAPYFADAQTGYFGYGNGFVIKTTNAGTSWFQISSGTGKSINDIDMFPNGNMIAVGDIGTILSSDGTSPWVQHNAITDLPIMAVHIINDNDVFIVNEEGQVFKSTNAGVSWEAAGIKPSTNFDAKDLHFISNSDGWVIGDGSIGNVLFHTTDGGNNWTAATGFGGYYISVDFEGNNGWALNIGGRYYYSTDNGTNWTMGELPGETYNIQDMDFYDESIGYAVGSFGYAARSNDGGLTWEVLSTPNNTVNFTDIYLLGPNELWISTNNDVAYHSANGGDSWSVLNIESDGFGSFNAIAAEPNGDAWTVGYQGYIERFIGPPPPPPNIPPVASFEFQASGLTVNFTESSTDPDGFIVSWSWNFGDGNSSTQQHPTHTYDTANTYIVTLTVTDNDGATGSTGKIVVVQPGPGGTFGDFTEVTPLDSLFVTPQDEDFWVITTAPADYDNDGDLDIAVLGYYVIYNQSVEDKLVLIRNDGPAGPEEWEFSYIDVPLGDITVGASDLAWGDVDGDGYLDLVVGSNGKTVLYHNDNGTLLLTDTELPGYWEDNDQADFDLRSITWADFDNDGDSDLLLPSVWDNSTFSYRTALMRNDGPNGTGGWIFSEIDSVFAPTSHAQSAWADFDGDQDLDLLLVNISPLNDDGFIRRYRNEGNGIFVGEDILGSLSVEHGEAQWGDYDGDGDLDILVAGNVKELDSTYTHMALRIYRNNNESYEAFDVIECIPCEGWFDLTAATWADYDSDGDMDILLAGTHNPGTGHIEGRARIYTNNNGVFSESGNELPAPRAAGTRGGTFSWFDIDNDGDLDYFIAGQYFVPGGNELVEAQMHVYRNDAQGQNNAPTTPSGLDATVQSDNSVLLSWNPSSDDHTPSASLTYDLVVVRKGRHTPSDNFNTRLPEPGNISAVLEWSLTGLQDGLYEWKISAVDAAYIGSLRATGEFSIGVTSAGESDGNLPIEYSLDQNYPNPFNPATVIKYTISEESFVTLIVYNAIGEEVATLINENLQAGNYQFNWNAINLPSGVYLYRLKAGNFLETKKMILLR
ncbi:MAG: YCF48-related protein [Ignavibacteriaceae bacterium]